MPVFKDLTGNKVGMLTIISYTPGSGDGVNRVHGKWLCMCDCGKEISVVTSSLTSGRTKSCGCQSSRHSIGARRTTHGESKGRKVTKELKAWTHMKERCYDVNCKEYPRWGGRGIKICDRWMGDNGFENFLYDMGRSPTPKHSIDRYPDNDGDYEPSNCRWGTPKQQKRNQGDTLWVEYKGLKKPLAEWCEELGLQYHMIWTRITKRGYSVTKAFEKPTGRYSEYSPNKFIPHSFGYINA